MIANEEKRWGVGKDTKIMSVGNSVGGLTTIEEKSLRALSKIGSKPIQGILEFSQKRHKKPKKPAIFLSKHSFFSHNEGRNYRENKGN